MKNKQNARNNYRIYIIYIFIVLCIETQKIHISKFLLVTFLKN
jgi:hypothetical protein